MTALRRGRLVVLTVIGVGVAAGVTAALPRGAVHTEGSVSAQAYELPECPHDWTKLPKALQLVPIDDKGFALTGPITNVPEFHDCQKLLVDGGNAYGPLVAVFAAYDLEFLERRLDSITALFKRDSTLGRGAGPAVTTGRQPTTARLAGVPPGTRDTAGDRIALAGGLILNLSGSAYAPLNIQTGFSCLYLWRIGAARDWQARIVWVDKNHEICLEPVRPDTFTTGGPAGAGLKVITDRPPVSIDNLPRSALGGYPAVARWDWDSTTAQQYINIGCSRHAVCQVGASGFTPSAPYSKPLVLPTVRSRSMMVRRVKSWYDQQILGIPRGDTVVPSGRKGTIFPDTSVGSRTLADYRGSWQTVAFIALDEGLPQYKEKLNLDPTPPGADLVFLNRLSFCWGPASDCLPPEEAVRLRKCEPTISSVLPRWMPKPRVWWVRIKPAGGGTPMYRCIERKFHDLEKPIPSIVRWRWMAKDETIWKECIQGCCEVQTDGP